jgi:GNAT superfamily N-acetyltransferase
MRHQVNVILARDVQAPLATTPLPPELRGNWLSDANSPQFAELERLLAAHQFPTHWANEMLGAADEAIVLSDAASGEAVAAGWIARRPFYVEEIRRTFDAGLGGDYYYGDLVTREWRGRGLQKRLIEWRLERSRAAGRRWAMALTQRANAASLQSYQTCSFAVATELRSAFFAGWRCDQTIRVDERLAAGSLSREGWPLPGSRRLRFT